MIKKLYKKITGIYYLECQLKDANTQLAMMINDNMRLGRVIKTLRAKIESSKKHGKSKVSKTNVRKGN